MEKSRVTNDSERRGNPRVGIVQPVLLNHASFGSESGSIEDVSLNGAFIRSEWKNLPVSTSIELTVTLGSGERRTVKEYQLPATVKRCTESGFGVQFNQLDMESYGALLELLYGY